MMLNASPAIEKARNAGDFASPRPQPGRRRMRLRSADPRSGRRYRKVRADFIARSKATNAPCWLQALGHCVFNGAPIDYNAAGRTPKSPELHHKLACATHPHLVYEP